jgi:site-specific recombinase XerC
VLRCARGPRAEYALVPDDRFDELFDRMVNHRNRALLTLFVSTGGRAAEVLGLQGEHVNQAGQRVLVTSKGSRLLESVPASAQALRFLAFYYDEHGTPAHGEAVFRTIRGPTRGCPTAQAAGCCNAPTPCSGRAGRCTMCRTR